MKINTKVTTPIKGYDHSYYHENKYIPTASIQDFENNDGNNNEQEPTGRIVKYETIVITTPILRSQRIDIVYKKQKSTCASSDGPSSTGKATPRVLLSKDDVDEINTKLNSLYIHDPDDDAMIPSKSIVINCQKSGSGNQAETNQTTFLGRCTLFVYNSSSRTFVEVIRSARLAFPRF
jgi:hypothetical protein